MFHVMENSRLRRIALIAMVVLSGASAVFAQQKPQPKGHVREYFIAAEQVEWDYAPSGLELMHGDDLLYPWGLQRRWTKTRFVDYTDGSFSQRRPQP